MEGFTEGQNRSGAGSRGSTSSFEVPASLKITNSNQHFAPLSTPLSRRLQTFAVLWHTISIPTIFCSFLFLWVYPFLWPLGISYLIWWFVLDLKSPVNGSTYKYSMMMRNLVIWKWFARYFPIELNKTVDLTPTFSKVPTATANRSFLFNYFSSRKTHFNETKTGPNYMFCYHPHGVISMGVMGAFATEGCNFSRLFPGIRVYTMTLLNQFDVPIHRDYIMSMGLTSANASNVKALLKKGQSVCCVVGGAQESLLATPGHNDLVLNKRKGFVKLALSVENVKLIPVYAFGETDIYNVLKPKKDSKGSKFQNWVKKNFRFTVPFFWARGIFNYDFGFLPFRRKISIVVGEPIDIPHLEDPSQSEVDYHHGIYVKKLKELFENNKEQYGYKDASLNIVE